MKKSNINNYLRHASLYQLEEFVAIAEDFIWKRKDPGQHIPDEIIADIRINLAQGAGRHKCMWILKKKLKTNLRTAKQIFETHFPEQHL